MIPFVAMISHLMMLAFSIAGRWLLYIFRKMLLIVLATPTCIHSAFIIPVQQRAPETKINVCHLKFYKSKIWKCSKTNRQWYMFLWCSPIFSRFLWWSIHWNKFSIRWIHHFSESKQSMNDSDLSTMMLNLLFPAIQGTCCIVHWP